MIEPSQASTASAQSCATLCSGSGVVSARITAEGFAAACGDRRYGRHRPVSGAAAAAVMLR